eukprot:6012728-Pleurochrysis_carterae.AAC.2
MARAESPIPQQQGQSQGSLRKVKQGGNTSMCRRLLRATLQLSNITSCIILLKGQLHARRALSKWERGSCPSYVKRVG